MISMTLIARGAGSIAPVPVNNWPKLRSLRERRFRNCKAIQAVH
jgi:hypothetical protein